MNAKEKLEQFLSLWDHQAKKSLGQNFLVSDHVIERIISRTKLLKPDHLIEVGPGPGALTEHLAQISSSMVLIEMDHQIAQHWKSQNYKVIEEDALRINWSDLFHGKTTVLVSNLPYQISSSLAIDRSLDEPGLAAMVLMFQKEVAQRIKAKASTEHYGLLSVILQNFWDIELVCEAGPRDFFPPPRVASRVLAFKRRASLVTNRKKFLNFVKAAFTHRRKMLKSNLENFGCSQDQILEVFGKFQISDKVRAEELTPEEYVKLYEQFSHSR